MSWEDDVLLKKTQTLFADLKEDIGQLSDELQKKDSLLASFWAVLVDCFSRFSHPRHSSVGPLNLSTAFPLLNTCPSGPQPQKRDLDGAASPPCLSVPSPNLQHTVYIPHSIFGTSISTSSIWTPKSTVPPAVLICH